MKKLGFLKRFMPCLVLCLSIMAGMGLFVMHSYATPMIQAGVISGVYDDEEEIKENDVQYEIMKYNDFKKRHFKDYGIYHFTLPTPHERKSSFDCS
jgi:hypothetical protein